MAEVCGSIQEPTSPDTLQAPLYMQGEKGGRPPSLPPSLPPNPKALRDSLLNHLHNLSDAPSPIVRQVCDGNVDNEELSDVEILRIVQVHALNER